MLWLAALVPTQAAPIQLHAENHHYFNFRGKPTILVASTEHYGAVLNLDFDFIPYLDELSRHGLNLTRTFSGVYCEIPGSFNIRENTLAPKPSRYSTPWAHIGDKFDLDRWDDGYFRRLKEFIAHADKREIAVEYVLFCPFYEDEMWAVSPMNARNNTNGVGNCPRTDVYTLKHADLQSRQEAFIRKVVGELNGFDNLYYEICNEPYFGGVTLEWQARIADVIVATEKDLLHKHLIAQNIANGKAKVERPNAAVSIFNFHYATPPDTVGLNYGLDRPIADDETGFKGTADRNYRREAWEFLLAGGAVFDHLDYSFTPEHEDGSAKVADPTPGGGGVVLRQQLATLKKFLEGFTFLRMAPDETLIRSGLPAGATARVLAERGKQYAGYIHSGKSASLERATLAISLPQGQYRGHWLDPRSGKILGEFSGLGGGEVELASPAFAEDIALRIVLESSEGR
jgi:hypothetical protein